jgi:molecular chaperone DnaK
MSENEAVIDTLQGKLIIGIDLGTTKSAVSVWDETQGRVVMLPNSSGKEWTPSLVGWDRAGSRWLVGDEAKSLFKQRPSDVVYSIKRFIGRWFTDPEVIKNYRKMTYNLVTGGGKEQLEDIVVDFGQDLSAPPRQSAPEISARVLKSLRQDAAAALKLPLEEVKYAVITVPAYFNVLQRKATARAGRMAGLEVVDILNEPTAAALSYNDRLRPEEKRILVYDLGGGTFDISLIEAQRDDDGYIFYTRIVDGDTHLGGDDIDARLVEWIKNEILQRYQETVRGDDDIANTQLRLAAERAKVQLGQLERVPLAVTLDLGRRAPFLAEIEITRAVLNECATEVISRARQITERAVKQIAGLNWDDIDEVLLVGGQTLMPAIQQDVENLTGSNPHVSERPQLAIALGAGEYAHILSLGEEKFHQNTLINVIALPLGVRERENDFVPLVKANVAVPHTSQPYFATNPEDNQTSIRVEVLQGSRDATRADQCVPLGALEMAVLPRPARSHKFEIVLDVKSDGTMKVIVTDKHSNRSETQDIVETKTVRYAQQEAEVKNDG